jgi:DNA invertase Pin-like site-specific DNA recombinase
MRENFKRLNASAKKKLITKVIIDCENLAQKYIETWSPVDRTWDTVEGCAYLRLSTEDQVLVEKGSLEQQVNIAISEAVIRSNSDKINYKISEFFIEAGITGRHDRRPEFNKMNRGIKKGVYKFCIIKEIARIARESQIWKRFFNLCIDKECKIIVRSFPFNPNDPTQILQLDILAAFAEYESNQISKRTKESNFSAMVTSGKFNSTHKILGLDQLVVNDDEKVGLYVPNLEELKTVTWIMKTFLNLSKYTLTAETCNSKGILNKDGKKFNKDTVKRLLTNKRYIGKWIVNEKNKHKNQDNLMPYDKYLEVELPHGCVIDLKLWNRVQRKVEEVSKCKSKVQNVARVYPLAGLIKHHDGSNFGGSSANGNTTRLYYYFNNKHGIRIHAKVLEDEARKIALGVIQKSPELVESIKRWGMEVNNAKSMLLNQIASLEGDIEELLAEKVKAKGRIDLFLGSEGTDLEEFKREFTGDFRRINGEIEEKRFNLNKLLRRKKEIEEESFSWKDFREKAEDVLKRIEDYNPAALRSAYGALFGRIVIGEENKITGNRDLKFVLKNEFDDVFLEDTDSTVKKMGWLIPRR